MMVQTIRTSALQVLFALAIILSVFGVYAADNNPTLVSWVVGAGGSTSTGGDYTLSSTAGQPVVGTSAGGSYTLHVGFWQPNAGSGSIYLPLIQR